MGFGLLWTHANRLVLQNRQSAGEKRFHWLLPALPADQRARISVSDTFGWRGEGSQCAEEVGAVEDYDVGDGVMV